MYLFDVFPTLAELSGVETPTTVFKVLGVPQDLHYRDQSGRPVPMVVGGKPIAELV